MIEKEEFTFMAERVNITNQDVINSLPGGSAARMQNLSYGYDIIIENKEMKVNLPYFGRTYNPSRDPDQSGFFFTSKEYTIIVKEGKKGAKTLTVKPKDVNNVDAIYIEISGNGKCFVSIDANDRQPISYSGYLMKNEIKKEKDK